MLITARFEEAGYAIRDETLSVPIRFPGLLEHRKIEHPPTPRERLASSGPWKEVCFTTSILIRGSRGPPRSRSVRKTKTATLWNTLLPGLLARSDLGVSFDKTVRARSAGNSRRSGKVRFESSAAASWKTDDSPRDYRSTRPDRGELFDRDARICPWTSE